MVLLASVPAAHPAEITATYNKLRRRLDPDAADWQPQFPQRVKLGFEVGFPGSSIVSQWRPFDPMVVGVEVRQLDAASRRCQIDQLFAAKSKPAASDGSVLLVW